MEFERKVLKNSLSVESIVSVHYFEYSKGFAFLGEIHDFWEIIYADRHQLMITAGNEEITLNIGEMYLHRPMEFHNMRLEEESVANSVVVSFVCDCPKLYGVAGKVIKCDSWTKQFLANIVSEAGNAFSDNLGDPYNNDLTVRPNQLFGSEQLIRLNLEALLIHLVRSTSGTEELQKSKPKTNQKLMEICRYLQAHCYEQITFKKICEEFSLSPSYIKRLFAAGMDCGVMEYFSRCKIDAAKELIRKNDLNFSGIAKKLNYSSVQYFSRHFKDIAGMTPSQYAASVKSFMKQ